MDQRHEARPRLTDHQRAGLDIPWWAYHVEWPLIAAACRAAQVDCWSARATLQFEHNGPSGRPTSWAGLAQAIRKHDKDLRKAKRVPERPLGRNESGNCPTLSSSHLNACAIALGVDAREMVPTSAGYLASSARWLLKLTGVGELMDADALAYGEYVFEATGKPHGDHLHLPILEAMLGRRPVSDGLAGLERSVLAVSGQLGQVLEATFNLAPPRRPRA